MINREIKKIDTMTFRSIINKFKDKDFLQTSLKESPSTHYVVIYVTICAYYLNKSHDSLKKSCD